MGHQGVLAIAGSEQVPLPGMPEGVRTPEREPIQPPLMNVWDGPSADQLSFAADQMVLQQLPAEPAQLAFLPDPPIWEVIEQPARQAPASGRLARRRARNRITPGQGSLF